MAHWSRFGCISLFGIGLAFSGSALGDGKVFPAVTHSTTPVIIPDQQAMIAYDNGVETLVVRNHFAGGGTDFAWVVPLPSMPTVSETSKGLFPTLEFICAPRVVHQVSHLWIWFLCASAILAVLICGRGIRALVVLALALIVWSILLPSLAGVQSVSAPLAGNVVVHDRRQIGSYEVATISSEKPDALVTWLRTGGFQVDQRSEGIIADYAAAKWFFCAVKLIRGYDGTQIAAAPPLAFRFATQRPVYPMRLTGTHEGVCNIDLYVFGPGRAELTTRGLSTVLCSQVEYFEIAERTPVFSPERTRVPIVHPCLRKLVRGDVIVTRLTGALTPATMWKDIHINWRPFEPARKRVYSRQGAAMTALNGGTAAACLVGLGLLVAARRKWISVSKAASRGFLASLVIGGVAVTGYGLVTKVEVHTSRLPRMHNDQGHRLTAREIQDDSNLFLETDDLNAIRQATQRIVGSSLPKWAKNNLFNGQPKREEDSPGNYGFRQTGRTVEYLWYDEDGSERAIHLGDLCYPATRLSD